MTDLGSLNYFLGISVTRDSPGMFLSQRKYATEILKRAYMVGCNFSQTPVDTESKLGDDGDLVFDLTLYRSLVGSLQYLTFIHPGISYVVQQVCLYMHDSREPYLSALKRILRGRVSWCCNVVAETCCLRNLLRELHTPLSFAMLVNCDNVGVVYLSLNPVHHQRTKHIEINIYFVQDLVVAGQVMAGELSELMRRVSVNEAKDEVVGYEGEIDNGGNNSLDKTLLGRIHSDRPYNFQRMINALSAAWRPRLPIISKNSTQICFWYILIIMWISRGY
nr:ribonuclease H-like domain-containing protein [Tanacetum cinerariifolium]